MSMQVFLIGSKGRVTAASFQVPELRYCRRCRKYYDPKGVVVDVSKFPPFQPYQWKTEACKDKACGKPKRKAGQ